MSDVKCKYSGSKKKMVEACKRSKFPLLKYVAFMFLFFVVCVCVCVFFFLM